MTGPVDRRSIIVLGYLVRGPLGGIAWHHLQYVLGLARLGHDVWFLEDSGDYPSCYDPVRNLTDGNPDYGLRFAARAFDRLGLSDRWCYHDAHRGAWVGPAAAGMIARCAAADVVLNLSGVNPLRPWLLDIPTRVLIDTDPAFTQIRHLDDGAARQQAALHTSFFTFGENIGQPGCAIPADGFAWQPTRQPIVLDAWPVTPGVRRGAFTSVMVWDSYRSATHAGVHYGMKADSFDPYLDLPARCADTFELALGAKRETQARLGAHGWRVCDSREPTSDPWAYQRYIAGSKAEFSVAKHGYVVAQSGWFSERSAAYLASGRPVVVQDTGFSRWLGADGGVLPFTSADEAVTQIQALNADYERHCDVARAVVETYFESGRVLTQLLEAATTARQDVHAVSAGS